MQPYPQSFSTGIINPAEKFSALRQQGGVPLKSGTCPKCNSKKIFSGAKIPLKKGPFGSNAIPVGLTSIAALDNYVCVDCGYVERYVSDPDKLVEISRKWDAIELEDVEEKETQND